MGQIIHINPSDTSIYRDDKGQHMDVYGQMLLVGIFSDLCHQRDQEVDPLRACKLDRAIKRLGKVLERYEPGG